MYYSFVYNDECFVFLSLIEGLPGISHALLFQRLYPLRAHWYTIGTCLHVSPGDLDAIRQECGTDCDMLLGKVLHNWERRKSDITWNDVIDMLIGPTMEAKGKRIAENIKRDFKVCHIYSIASKPFIKFLLFCRLMLKPH